MEKHPCHQVLHPINIHRIRRSQQGGCNGSEGDGLDDSKNRQSIPVEKVWTGQEVNKVVAMGLHEGTNPKTYRPIVPGKEGAGSITASASSITKNRWMPCVQKTEKGRWRLRGCPFYGRHGMWWS